MRVKGFSIMYKLDLCFIIDVFSPVSLKLQFINA